MNDEEGLVCGMILKIRYLWFCGILFLLLWLDKGISRPLDHAIFDTLLQKYVVDGLVDYPGLISDHEMFDRYCQQLQSVQLKDFLTWSPNERKAFWINAHNAICMSGIISHYPTNVNGAPLYYKAKSFSVRSLKNFRNTIFIKLMGMNITLDQIRDEILQDEFKDVRIYFVLSNAAQGGPRILNHAFTSENVDKLLDSAIITFVKNPNNVYLDQETNTLHLSVLFRWFREGFADFHKDRKWIEYNRDMRGLVEFIYHILPNDEKEFLIKYNPRIRWEKYDWSLDIISKQY